jgi:hypothetical protein
VDSGALLAAADSAGCLYAIHLRHLYVYEDQIEGLLFKSV